jgi:hypothetical protein
MAYTGWPDAGEKNKSLARRKNVKSPGRTGGMEPFLCECGTTLFLKEKNAEASMGRHLSSKVHAYRRDVERMLSETSLRHSEIAFQLGITRKDITWIAGKLGSLHGKARWTAAAAENRLARWWSTAGKHPVVRKCMDLGFVVEPFMAKGSNNYYRRTIFLVNGHLVVCLLFHAARGPSQSTMWSFRAKQDPGADFQVGKAGKSFYVFPQALLKGSKRTSFADHPAFPDHPLSRSLLHDHEDYRNAWHLLATPKRGWKPSRMAAGDGA